MCACGCLVVLGLAGALAYCIMHQMWIAAAGVVIAGGVMGWLGVKAMQKS